MSPSIQAVAADRVFDGDAVHHDAAVVIEDDKIARVLPRAELPRSAPLRALPEGAWLAPGFIDLQVNGGGDVLFNDSPTPEAISTIVKAHRKFGTTSLLPTFITDAREKMRAAVAAARTSIADHPSVLGIHLEGPFLSPKRPGVHAARYIRTPDADDLALLTAPHRGAMLVTLAPERVPQGFIARLAAAGVRVSLGHSMASYEQTRAAIAEGLTGFTHLFNAMPPLTSRAPGPVAAALDSAAVFYGLIVDGHHVDPATLRVALRGAGRPMLVSDAMPPVGGKQTRFRLYGEEITVANGRCTRADGALAGSALSMAKAVENCVTLLGVRRQDALRFASAHPADFLGLGETLGRLAPGYRADLVAFDPQTFAVIETWVAGVSAAAAG
jgi:N-acetylglucosamine-6-phosphate deacetylase